MPPSTSLQRQLYCHACRHTTKSLMVTSRNFTTLQLPTASSTRPQPPAPQSNSFSRALTTQQPTHRSKSTSNPTTRAPQRPPPSAAASAALKSKGLDRGPASTEETQTDFAALNVLGGATAPSTSIDMCDFDGFALDSGLQVGEGDGVVLVSGEAFVWRPWMVGGEVRQRGDVGGNRRKRTVVNGGMMRGGTTESERTGGVLNAAGQFEIKDEAWGMLRLLWPKPDLLIIGTGRTIRPLAPATRTYLQSLGMRIEILDTRNAASQFNMLATERGVHEVAAALVPLGFGAKG